jgi:F420-dependent methylenetetrahydromethanopterin dehydrogenase
MTAFNSDAMKLLSICGFVGLLEKELNKIQSRLLLQVQT